jgi:hypothetical protein
MWITTVGVRTRIISYTFRFSKKTAVAGSDRQLLWRLREQRHCLMASSVTQRRIESCVLVVLVVLLYFWMLMML